MSLFHAALQPALDSNGDPISGATWNFYLTGTTTPTSVYSDNALTTSLGTSETADAAGRFAVIFLNDNITYRAILKDASGTTIKDIDPVNTESNQLTTPAQYGAVGDGTTDDTAAIQATIDAIAETGALFIPEGTYKITDTIEIKLDAEWAGLHLFGTGAASKIVWAGGNDKPMIHVRGDGVSGLGFNSKLLIENFYLYGESYTGDTYSGVVGIQIGDTPENVYSGVCNLTIQNMLIRHVKTGILGYYESDECSIVGNHIKTFTDYGIYNAHGGSGWWITRNHISGGSDTSVGVRTSLVGSVISANIIQSTGMLGAIQVDGGTDDEGKATNVIGNYLECQDVTADFAIKYIGVDTGIIEGNNINGFALADLIILADAADAGTTPCSNIRIGPNRHSQSGGVVNSLVSATSNCTNCQITGKQKTTGAVTTISGTFTAKNFDGVVEVSQGFKFPSTQNSSSNANTLDDYKESAVTLGIKVGATAQTTSSVAKATKVGRLVTVTGYVAMGAAVSGTGGVTITGLPNAASGIAAVTISPSHLVYSGTPNAYISDGGTTINLVQTTEAGTRSALTETALASNTEIDISVTYTVAT